MTSPAPDPRDESPSPAEQPDPAGQATPTAQPPATVQPSGPAAPQPPANPLGIFGDTEQPDYDEFYRDVYREPAPGQAQPAYPPQPQPGYPQAQPYAPQPQPGYPQAQPYAPQPGYGQQPNYPMPQQGQPGYPAYPQQPGYPVPSQPRDHGLALGLTAVGFLGVAGLQYFYIGKIGKGIAYLLTAGFFGIGTIVSLFTMGDEVARTNDERARGLRP